MFYCDTCAKERGWPDDALVRSYGPCYICKSVDSCNDIPASELPPPNEVTPEYTEEILHSP